MTICRLLFVALAVAIPLTSRAQVPGLPTLDFKRYFPEIIAVSVEQRDQAFPDGFQYKFLSIRDEVEHVDVIAEVGRGMRLVGVGRGEETSMLLGRVVRLDSGVQRQPYTVAAILRIDLLARGQQGSSGAYDGPESARQQRQQFWCHAGERSE